MKNNLNELILHFDGTVYNLCYKIINESQQLESDFEYLCENLFELPEKKTIVIDQYILQDEYDLIKKIYNARTKGILSEVINKVNYGMLDEKNFYVELYNNLIRNYCDKKELAVAFECVLSDYRIPFVYLGKPLSMSQNDYSKYLEKNENNLKKILYILKTGYSQKTEEASILLNYLESIESYEDKVVVFAQLLDILKKGGIAKVVNDLIVQKKEEEEKKDE